MNPAIDIGALIVFLVTAIYFCGFRVASLSSDIKQSKTEGELSMERLKQEITKQMGGLEVRLERFDSYIKYAGMRAANVLISPHTPKLDELLRLFSANKELDDVQWKEMVQLCHDIENNKDSTRESRSLAGTVLATVAHMRNESLPQPIDHSKQFWGE